MADNSLRYLLEADQHYKAAQLPSPIASAILSIEETGKFSGSAAGLGYRLGADEDG